MSATSEGRAFEGAFTLLRNEELLHQLRADLQALLDHPMAEEILADSDRRELRMTLAFIRRGIEDVLAQRSRATKAIKDYIQTHDAARDRELDATLRALDTELGRWLEHAGPRTRVPLQLLPETHDLRYLPRRFHDPVPQGPPAPLPPDVDDFDDAAGTLAEMLAFGGPSLLALRAALADAAGTAGVSTLGQLFADLPGELRRPVEVFGLLHVAEGDQALTDDPHATEDYVTVRPDGTTRTLRVPRITVHAGPTDDLERT